MRSLIRPTTALFLGAAVASAQVPDSSVRAGLRGRSIGPVATAASADSGGNRAMPVETGDYRVVLEVDGRTFTPTLRVVRVGPDEKSVLAPVKRL